MTFVPFAIALACAVLWGAGYTALQPASLKLTNPAINLAYGAVLALVNVVALSVTKQWSNFQDLHNPKIASCLFGYVSASVAAAYLFLWGFQMVAETFTGAYRRLQARIRYLPCCLPFCFESDPENLVFTVLGVALIAAGVVLLSLGK